MQFFNEDQQQHLTDTVRQVSNTLFNELLPKILPVMEVHNLDEHQHNLVMYRVFLRLAATYLGSVSMTGGGSGDDIRSLCTQAELRFEQVGEDVLEEFGLVD